MCISAYLLQEKVWLLVWTFNWYITDLGDTDSYSEKQVKDKWLENNPI